MRISRERFRLSYLLFFCLLAIFFAISFGNGRLALGQTTFGSIVGTAADPSGAVIPKVQVTLTNLGTNAKQSTTTNSAGIYEFVNVLPGSYQIDATKAGFKRFIRSPIVVQVQQSYRIDFALQVGAVTQRVSVTAATPLLQPQTSSLGQVIAGRSVTEMPLNGRNIFNLMELAPSVVPQGESEGVSIGQNAQGPQNYQVNGSIAGLSAFYLDGMPMNNAYFFNSSLLPTQDSIQEFKVQTDNLGPEWGGFAGGVMNLSTKSGTNLFHGTAYEYLRNKVLDSNNFFNNEAHVPVGAFTQNQFGVALGGPVYLPGVYNGKDKSFWFFSYEGIRLREGESFTESVPTAAEDQGDFSNLRDSSGAQIPIYNPLTVCGELGNPACPVVNGSPVYTRQQFPGNVIPPSMINPTSKALENLWAPPNTVGQQFTNFNNWVGTAPYGGNTNEYVARFDQNVSDKQHFFGRWTTWTQYVIPTNPYKSGECANGQCTENYLADDVVLDDTYSWTPTLLTDIHIGLLRDNYDRTPVALNYNLASIGMPSFLDSEIPGNVRSFPQPCPVDLTSDIFCSQGSGSVILDHTIDYFASGDVTWVHGRHTFVMGEEYLPMRFNYAQNNVASGVFNFGPGYTQEGPFTPVGGFDYASYLLGYADGGGNNTVSLVAAQQINQSLYFGDTWQATHKLTLNLGLRWDVIGPWSERFNRMSSWNLNVANPVAQANGIQGVGEICVVDSSCRGSRNAVNTDYRDFAPRFGLAYRLTNKTVVRGGYGIFYIPILRDWSETPNNDFVNAIGTPFITTYNGGITPANPTQGWSNPFPTGIVQPIGHSQSEVGTLMLNSDGATADVPNAPPGYMQQWNFDIQQELPKGLFLDVAYAGSRGNHLAESPQSVNNLPDKYLALGTALDNQVPNPWYGLVTQGYLSTPTITESSLLQPYGPYYIGAAATGWADSYYNSMQLKLEKRFTGGGTLLAAYTLAKFMDDTDSVAGWLEGNTGGEAGVIDWNCYKCSYSLSSDDYPQRLVISYVQNLPIGQGQRFLSGVHGLPGKLISGWGADGITTFMSGAPLKIGNSGGGTMPNRVCKNAKLPGSAESRLDEWFNTSCFQLSAPFTYGDESRVDPNLRQEGMNNWDFALFKNTNFGPAERFGVQFRAEFFNLFNRPQFGAPATTVGVSNFGLVSTQINNPRLIQFALRFMF
jgi:hypothetical protein